METIKFNTNINRMWTGSVGPALNETAGDNAWKLDIDSSNKILTIERDFNEAEISAALKRDGYSAERL